MIKLKIKEQHAPFSIQIEPTEGCNLGCSFCGLRGMRLKGTKPWYFMTLKTANKIANEIQRAGWNSKIIFAMHGEPTLNPDFFNIIRLFRKRLPDNILHLITNGYGIVNHPKLSVLEYVNKLKELGINNLILDNYSDNGDWKRITDECESTYEINNLVLGVPMFSNTKKFRIIVVPPIRTEKISFVRNLTNHCGAAFPLSDKCSDKRCTTPFRELSFRYDGTVSLCCDDFRGQYPISSIDELPIEEIWNHERFQVARIMLYNKQRQFSPCLGCTNVSMRVGLLPDPTGKGSLPEITKEIRNLAISVSKEKPLSKIIVKRKWEI